MKSALLILFLAIPIAVWSQGFPQDQWYEGSVTLDNGQTKKGIIKYDLNANSIQLSVNDKIETYHASQFYTFSIIMREEKLKRDFYVLPFKNKAGYDRPTIFELITEGTKSLLAREYIATSTSSAGSYSGYSRYGYRYPYYNPSPLGGGATRRYLAFNLYLADDKGAVTELNSKKSDVIEMLGNHEKALKRYLKKEKLKVDRVADMAKLVEYYNQLENL